MLGRANAGSRVALRGIRWDFGTSPSQEIRRALGRWPNLLGGATRDVWERDRWARSRVAQRGIVTTLSPAHVVKGADRNPMAVGPPL